MLSDLKDTSTGWNEAEKSDLSLSKIAMGLSPKLLESGQISSCEAAGSERIRGSVAMIERIVAWVSSAFHALVDVVTSLSRNLITSIERSNMTLVVIWIVGVIVVWGAFRLLKRK